MSIWIPPLPVARFLELNHRTRTFVPEPGTADILVRIESQNANRF
jgi:hypothetical protein